ncbi:hypothetical protein ACVXHY_25665, partial [Enterobacter roggenkampii]
MNWQRFNKVSSFSGETSGIVKKNFIITAALLSSLFLAAIVNLLYIADNLNNKADARSSLLLQKALTNRQEKIRANLMDNADWGEAYNNLHKQVNVKEGANKQVISSQADSLIKISRIWADFFPANTSN